MLTSIAADLSVRLLNYANLTLKHLPTIGQWVIIPDKILYKNLGSFSSAIGRVINVENRTIFIKLANNETINRAASDIIPCSANKFDQISLDILDLPLFNDNQDHFKEINSQYEIFLPTINLDQDGDNSNDVLQDHTVIPRPVQTDDIQIDPTYRPDSEEKEENNQSETLRRSSRGHRPSKRFLARDTDADHEG